MYVLRYSTGDQFPLPGWVGRFSFILYCGRDFSWIFFLKKKTADFVTRTSSDQRRLFSAILCCDFLSNRLHRLRYARSIFQAFRSVINLVLNFFHNFLGLHVSSALLGVCGECIVGTAELIHVLALLDHGVSGSGLIQSHARELKTR